MFPVPFKLIVHLHVSVHGRGGAIRLCFVSRTSPLSTTVTSHRWYCLYYCYISCRKCMLSDMFGNFGSFFFFPLQRLMCTLENLTKFRAIRKEAGVLVVLSADSHISHFISGFTFKNPAFPKERGLQVPSKPSLTDCQSFITSVERIGSVTIFTFFAFHHIYYIIFINCP